jgi:hypothetical protein
MAECQAARRSRQPTGCPGRPRPASDSRPGGAREPARSRHSRQASRRCSLRLFDKDRIVAFAAACSDSLIRVERIGVRRSHYPCRGMRTRWITTGVANLIPWADRFEKQRRLVLSAGMIACHGRVQREGEVIHVITERLEDLSDMLRSIGERDEPFPIKYGRGDGATHPGTRDPRDGTGRVPGRAGGPCETFTSRICGWVLASRCQRETLGEHAAPHNQRPAALARD